MSDEKLYLDATNEVEGNQRDPALWAKVMALSEGNEEAARYKYINLRVEQLAKNKTKKKPSFAKKMVNEFDLKYMPISDFSRIKSITENKVIEMIKDGFYVGQIKNNEWFVSRDEVGKEEHDEYVMPKPSHKSKAVEKEYIPVEEFAEFKGITAEKAVQMIKDGFYQGQIIEDHWYVAYSEIDTNLSGSTSDLGGFFSKLARGDFGLAKTYWLYGVLVGVVIHITANAITSVGGYVVLLLGYTAYEIPVLLGTWRASDKYKGSNVWAVLAKIAVVLGWFWLGVGLVAVFGLINA